MEYRGRIDVDHLLNSPWMEQFIRAHTEMVESRARMFVSRESGRLANSIQSRTFKHGGVKRDRVVGVVSASATVMRKSGEYNYAAGKEFGNAITRPEFFLRRALLGG